MSNNRTEHDYYNFLSLHHIHHISGSFNYFHHSCRSLRFSHSSWFISTIFLGGLSGLAVTLFPLRLVSRVSKLIQRNRCATCDSLGTELGPVEELRHPGKSRRSIPEHPEKVSDFLTFSWKILPKSWRSPGKEKAAGC